MNTFMVVEAREFTKVVITLGEYKYERTGGFNGPIWVQYFGDSSRAGTVDSRSTAYEVLEALYQERQDD